MSLMINEECIACDACREECPNNAIDEGDPNYTIDPELCTECVGFYDEPACVAACPVDAILADPDNAETLEELKYKHAQLQKGE